MDFPEDADPDGAGELFAVMVEGTPEAYRRFVEDYYEQPVDGATVSGVYALLPLTEALARRLNPDLSLAELADDLAQIGYPSRAGG